MNKKVLNQKYAFIYHIINIKKFLFMIFMLVNEKNILTYKCTNEII
jgi:hypothetical protein